MKYGPISADSSAMIKAIANPSSVVCTVSPLKHCPAQRDPPRNARLTPMIAAAHRTALPAANGPLMRC
jgi:hypothetical protein